MAYGIKLEWTEPGPAEHLRLLVEYGPEYDHRDPTESDLTRALELLAPEVRGRVIAKWRMRVDSQECGEEIRDLKNRLALSEHQVTIATASAYAARSPGHIVAAMREMPADVLERVLAPFAHEKGTILVERRAAEVRAEKAERLAFEQQLALDDLRDKLTDADQRAIGWKDRTLATEARATMAENRCDDLRAQLEAGMGWYAESVVNEVRAQREAAEKERDAAIAKLEAVRKAAG